MDVVYAEGKATARQIWERLADPPTYATVRTILRVLVEKSHLTFHKDGRSYVYVPVRPREDAATSATARLLETFYGGSVEKAVSGILGVHDKNLDPVELERIEQLIKQAKEKSK